MQYFSPTLDLLEKTGINVRNDWNLTDHAGLQQSLLPTGNVSNGYNEEVVERLLASERWADKYVGFDRYHAAFGMISQFPQEDIEYFIEVPWRERDPGIEKVGHQLSALIGYEHFQWVVSKTTLLRIGLQSGPRIVQVIRNKGIR